MKIIILILAFIAFILIIIAVGLIIQAFGWLKNYNANVKHLEYLNTILENQYIDYRGNQKCRLNNKVVNAYEKESNENNTKSL